MMARRRRLWRCPPGQIIPIVLSGISEPRCGARVLVAAHCLGTGTSDSREHTLATSESFEQVDLTNCDREPIHIPGRVQPHGLLLALSQTDLTIIQISSNITQQTGLAADALLGQPLAALVAPEYVAYLRNMVAREQIEQNPLYVWTVRLQGNPQRFDGLIHSYQGVLILELEPTRDPGIEGASFYHLVKSAIGRLQRAASFTAFCDATAREVRALIGYDRVMVYRFDEDDHGTVIAEVAAEGLPSYLGLHYPASDIPKQARALYLRNWLRLIPDTRYTPADIVPTLTPGTDAPLDLSYAVLRSVSPIHIEYLANMGVGASMSISLIKDGQLWGLIACHNTTPAFVPFELRSACEFLAQAVSLQLGAKENAEAYSYRMHLKDIVGQLAQRLAATERWRAALTGGTPSIVDQVDCDGAALCAEGQLTLLGATPPESDIRRLIAWLAEKTTDDIFATNSLANDFPELAHCKDTASGVLAAPISREAGEYVLWFRREVLQTVDWAGQPEKAVAIADDGVRLSPRKSFDLWQQTVALHSLHWQAAEIEAAADLRNTIRGVVLRRAAELAQLNTALERSNMELDAFAYIASHDLKEPLRGMHNYAHFLLEDYQHTIDADGQAKLHTLMRLAQRMDTLLESLLHYSRVGRVDLAVQITDLDKLVREILDRLTVTLEQQQVEVRIPERLPTMRCDYIRVGELFYNLIANAIKYNTKPEKWVEIGYQPFVPDPTDTDDTPRLFTFWVRDNGIGIAKKHYEAIFRIFRRLHGRDQFGGGAGAGLTIAKKIVERHGGSIWLESSPGVGTTFFFTLQDNI